LLGVKSKIPTGLTQCGSDLQTFKCQNLDFAYPETERLVLNDISLDIRPELLGICGPTGCGKTSLCQILARMFPVADSTLFAGHTDVNQLNPESVQQNISYVSQEPLLFSSTIAENIAFGVPDTTREEIITAAKAAAIHDEIMNFADGYNSHIGEKGVNLSGGQRQRIAFARALACDRPVMIIDDALAAVDTATEQRILDTVLPLLHGKTVIWVSQRIKQLSKVDRLLVLEDGKISSLGSYHDLCQTDPFLKEIHHRQSLSDTIGGGADA
jgi:ATP-binding cassette subfamily B protein